MRGFNVEARAWSTFEDVAAQETEEKVRCTSDRDDRDEHKRDLGAGRVPSATVCALSFPQATWPNERFLFSLRHPIEKQLGGGGVTHLSGNAAAGEPGRGRARGDGRAGYARGSHVSTSLEECVASVSVWASACREAWIDPQQLTRRIEAL